MPFKNKEKRKENWTEKTYPKWKGVAFDSMEERDCAKKLLTKPIPNVNVHVEVGDERTKMNKRMGWNWSGEKKSFFCDTYYTKSHFIDFFPRRYDKMYQGKFVEYHPFKAKGHKDRSGRTPQSYRRKIENLIAHSKYKGRKLILLEKIPK